MTATAYPVPDGTGPRADPWHAWHDRRTVRVDRRPTGPSHATRPVYGPPVPVWSIAGRCWLLRRPGTGALHYPNPTTPDERY